MSEILQLPYFTKEEGCFKYLGQYPYLETEGIDSESPAGRKILLAEGIYVNRPDFPATEQEGCRTVILEPHPDDAALSASGYMMNAVGVGGVCRVMNVFSKTAIDRFPWKDKVAITEEQLEDLRLEESRLAVEELLGQQFESLRLPLASKRGYEEIFGENHNDQELVQNITGILIKSVLEFGADVVLCPLAVQGHIDHLVTFDIGVAIKRQLGEEVKLVLYEDYPYARNKSAYAYRLRSVMDECRLVPEYVKVDDYLDIMADTAIIYRSQFDDINRAQMHAIMREDFRAVGAEARFEGVDIQTECAQRYWRVCI